MTSISFTGDIAFSKYFKDHWDKEFLDEEIKDFLNNSDHVVANVECPLTDTAISSDRAINHFSNPKAGEWFKGISADVWNLSNNHILDCGETGMLDTIKIANENGAVTVGAGSNVDEASKYITFDCEGGIGIFAVTYKRGEFIRATENNPGCILFDETKRIKQVISEIKKKHKWCIVIAHGGDEFSNLALPYMRKLYKSFLKMGADVIIGHHPHVVQNYEKVGDKIIFYSLGNFVFDTDYQRKHKYSEYGVLVKLKIDNDNLSWDYIATKVNREKTTVEKSEAPVIFRDIKPKDYKLLWPLGAKSFMGEFEISQKFSLPETRDFNQYNWFKRRCEKVGFKNALCLYWGRFVSKFGMWKRANKELKEYIEQK